MIDWDKSFQDGYERLVKPVQSTFLKVGGERFQCQCGCKLFHHPDSRENIYECNSCELRYEAE